MNKLSKHDKHERWEDKEWYTVRRILGNQWAHFFVLVGPRENGKSYSMMKFFVHAWKTRGIPFNWIRLSEESLNKMLANNGEKFIDADIRRQYNLDLHTKGSDLYDGDKCMCRGFALSTMAKDKGVALFDKDFLNDPNMWYHLGIDEFNLEKQEKKMFDVTYNLVNELENLLRSTKERIRIFMAANMLEEGSEVLSKCFNFIPLKYGTYKLKSKKALIEYIKPNRAYVNRRKDTIADLLGAQKRDSTFSNNIEHDLSLIIKKRPIKPLFALSFNKYEVYTVWDDRLVKKYNGEKVRFVAMTPYQNIIYDKKLRDGVINLYHNRGYRFDALSTQISFQSEIEKLKPKG